MVVKLQPQQITDLWDSIRYGVMEAITPMVENTPDNIQDILIQLLRHDMQCWCIFDKEKNIYGYVVTSISIDINTKCRTLLIYSLFFYNKAAKAMWEEASDAIEEFAKANSCNRIVAYTTNEEVITLADKFGYSSDCTLLVKNI